MPLNSLVNEVYRRKRGKNLLWTLFKSSRFFHANSEKTMLTSCKRYSLQQGPRTVLWYLVLLNSSMRKPVDPRLEKNRSKISRWAWFEAVCYSVKLHSPTKIIHLVLLSEYLNGSLPKLRVKQKITRGFVPKGDKHFCHWDKPSPISPYNQPTFQFLQDR